MSLLLKYIGKQVRIERKKMNLSQEEFADKTDLHRTFIGDIENAKRNISISTLEKILSAIEINFSDFFSLVEKNLKENEKNEK